MKAVKVFPSIIDGSLFLHTLEHEILPIMNPFPGIRSVLILDGALIHQRFPIYALCHLVGVLVLFLPAFSYDYSPIELAFKDAKSLMMRTHGLQEDEEEQDNLAEDLESCLWRSVTPKKACNHFAHCFIEVTDYDREWALNH